MKSQDKRVTNKVQKASAKSAFTPLLPSPPPSWKFGEFLQSALVPTLG